MRRTTPLPEVTSASVRDSPALSLKFAAPLRPHSCWRPGRVGRWVLRAGPAGLDTRGHLIQRLCERAAEPSAATPERSIDAGSCGSRVIGGRHRPQLDNTPGHCQSSRCPWAALFTQAWQHNSSLLPRTSPRISSSISISIARRVSTRKAVLSRRAYNCRAPRWRAPRCASSSRIGGRVSRRSGPRATGRHALAPASCTP